MVALPVIHAPMEFHEVANIFPLIEGKEFDDLVEDIRTNGLQQSIWTYQGKIIDGRNRYRACLVAGVEPHYQEWDGKGSLISFTVSMNVKRRHLDSNQRAMIAAHSLPLYEKEAAKRHGGDHKSEGYQEEKNCLLISGKASDLAAKDFGTNAQYVKDAKNILENTPELEEHVANGTITVSDAKAIAELPKEHRAEVVEKAAKKKKETGKRASKVVKDTVKEKKSQLKQEARQEALTTTVIDLTNYRLHRCAVSELRAHVEPASVDVIITDPPYPQEYLHVYDDLGQFAAHALKPGGSLIAMVGQSYLPDIIKSLCAHLTYHWTACYFTPGAATAIWQRNVNCSFKPLLWFVKGEYTGTWISDVFKSESRDKEYHHWGQSESGMAGIIECFSSPGQVVCDPFVGGGTTAVVAASLKRYFVGCDIEQLCVDTTLQRIREVLS